MGIQVNTNWSYNRDRKHRKKCIGMNTTSRHTYFQSELHKETKKLLHSESDLDLEPSDDSSRQISQKRYISLAQLLQVLLSIVLWNQWLAYLLIDTEKRIKSVFDQILLCGLSNLIAANNSSNWSIKCLGTLTILLLVTVLRTIIEVSMLGISMYGWVANNMELCLRQLI